MAVRKAEVVYVGDAASIVRAAKAAEQANTSLATGIKASADQIVAAQDRIVAAGNKVAEASVKAGDSQAKAAALAGRAAMDEAKSVGASTTEQVAAYRRATDAAVKASEEQSAAAARAAVAARDSAKKQMDSSAALDAGVAGAAKKGGEGLLALAVVAEYSAVKFQASMELMHTQAGAPTAEIQKMSKAVLQLGLTTEQGPNALAKALYPLESVGMRGATALAALTAASKGAAVGGADLTETTHALAGVMVALHEKAGDAAKQMGAIDAVVGVGKMTMGDFVQALSSGIIPTAHAVGLSFASISSGLATMTDAGVPAEQAATKMRTILLMLAHEHTQAATDGLKSVGLTADQLATTMRKPGNGLLDVLQLLSTHMDKLSKVQKVDLMSALAGGSRSAGTLITLLDQMDRVKNKYGQIQTLSTQFNQRVAAESDTASHKIKVAWSVIQVAFISAGTALLPMVSKILGAIEKFIVEMQKGVGAGGKFAAGIKDAATGIKVATAWMVTAFNDVETAITNWVTKNQAEIGQFTTAVSNFATGIYNIMVPVFNFLLAVTQRVWAGIQQTITGALSVLNGVVKIFTGVFTGDWSKAWQGVKDIFTGAVNGVIGIVRAISAPLREAAALAGGAIASGFKTAFDAVTGAVTGLMNDAINIVKGVFNTLYDLGKYIVEGLISGITSLAGKVLDTIKSVVMAPVNAVKGLLGINSPSTVFRDIGLNMMQGLTGGLLSAQAMVQDGLNQSFLFPVDAAIAALQAKEATLNAIWAKQSAAQQRSQLVDALNTSTTSGGSAGATSSTGSTAGVPAGVTAMLAKAISLKGAPYSKANHAAAFDQTAAQIKQFGIDCSGLVSVLLKAGKSGITSPQTTQGLPTAAGLSKGTGKYVTVYDRSTGATADEHTIISIMGKFFESGGNSKYNPGGKVSQLSTAQAKGELSGGGFVAYHPTNLNSSTAGMASVGAKLAASVTPSGKLTANQMRGLLYAQGFRGKDLDTAVAIGFAESQGNTNAIGHNTNGSTDRGFMQINSVHGAMSTTNPTGNAKSAYAIYKAAGGTFKDWSTYQSGAYKKYLGNTGSGTGTMTVNNTPQINALENQLTAIRRERDNLPIPASGKAGDAQRLSNERERKKLANDTLTIETKIKKLKAEDTASAASNASQKKANSALQALQQFDQQAKQAAVLAKIDLQIKNLQQLDAFKNAITSLKTQVAGLAQQAAQAWNTIQTGKINATHDATIAAINSGPQSQQLAALQAQDAAEQTANTIATNQAALDAANTQYTSAVNGAPATATTAAVVGGDPVAIAAAVAAQQQAQQTITDFARTQQEQQLQDQITTATTAADDAQTTALNGLTQQTTDYQNMLDAQLNALTTSLGQRTINYATWAKDVNKILAPYGLSASTDPTTEGTVDAGPGPAGAAKPVKKGITTVKLQTIARAGGGPVQPGYVYRVGENGPEDVAFGRPGNVMTANQTRNGGNGGPLVHIENANFTGTQAAKSFADRLAFRASIGTA